MFLGVLFPTAAAAFIVYCFVLGIRHGCDNARSAFCGRSTFRCCIVVSCSGCNCCGVQVALGGKDVLAMLSIANVWTLLLMIKDCCRSTLICDCHVVVWMSRLSLPLSDCVQVALGGKDVVVTKMLIAFEL